MKKYSLLLFFVSILFFSCEEILIEEDISDDSVTITAPVNNAQFSSTSVTFTWEPLEYATQYRLQIAKPNFASAMQIVLDTVVTSTSFTQQLAVGDYEWKVRAENGSSHTGYSNRFVSVLNNTDFQSNTVTLSSPANNFVTNQTSQNLSWQAVIGATSYQVQIYNGSGDLVDDHSAAATAYTYVFPQGNCQWKVRASNGTQQTVYSTRSLLVDTTVPNTPTLVSPANLSSTDSEDISFQWNRTAIAGSVEKDSIYIYSDSALNTLVSKNQAVSPYTHNLDSGTYYWKVRAFDEAGNTGSASGVFSFTVN